MHGTDAYTTAVEETLDVARAAAEEVRKRPYTRLLVEPDLSVVLFERVGWSAADYEAWSKKLLRTGTAFVLPTTHEGRPATRFAIINPRTTITDIRMILATMA
jgi:glutamate/tyrosine decarboxylase-like PLP-dependent enzyme